IDESGTILDTRQRGEQVRAIMRRMTAAGTPILATRASAALYRSVRRIAKNAIYHELARAITIVKPARRKPARVGNPDVLVITAGTSDIPVAEEALVTLDFLGIPAWTLYDVGVAGLHRLAAHRNRLEAAGVLIVAAGMDGALPSVVGGWTDKPVVAVPTSVGYGASFGGVAALLTMLNACAPGIAVVNIDNGFGAAVLAQRILQLRQQPEWSR
ncbi:MAG TPA: nickel pincer cofactor biosynthesis protein LarB, partial [Nitrospiria bacterium]